MSEEKMKALNLVDELIEDIGKIKNDEVVGGLINILEAIKKI